MTVDLSPKEIVLTDDLITLDAIATGCRELKATYWKRDFLFRGGKWRGVYQFPLLLQPWLVNGCTIVVGHSDLRLLKSHQVALRLEGAVAIFGVNTRPALPRVFSLPLGLTNATRESRIHETLGNQIHLREAYSESTRRETFSGRVYANFSIDTNPAERLKLWEMVRHHRDFVVRVPEISDSGRVAYLSDLRACDFVLCPEGNGIDTHRLWETLYMGGYPIVRRNPAISSLVADLPVLVVDDWREVLDMEFLESNWHAFGNVKWAFEKLTTSYWIRAIAASTSINEPSP